MPVQTPMVSDVSPAIAAATGRVTRSSTATATSNAAAAASASPETLAADSSDEGEGPRVHARGPEVIGMEDMGPQARGTGMGGLDIEGALGRRGEAEGLGTSYGNVEEQRNEQDITDGEGDVVIADADGVAEGEEGADSVGQM